MTAWTVACKPPLSMGCPRQEYWSGLPFPFPEDLPNPGIKPGSPALQADSSPSEPPGKPIGKVLSTLLHLKPAIFSSSTRQKDCAPFHQHIPSLPYAKNKAKQILFKNHYLNVYKISLHHFYYFKKNHWVCVLVIFLGVFCFFFFETIALYFHRDSSKEISVAFV